MDDFGFLLSDLSTDLLNLVTTVSKQKDQDAALSLFFSSLQHKPFFWTEVLCSLTEILHREEQSLDLKGLFDCRSHSATRRRGQREPRLRQETNSKQQQHQRLEDHSQHLDSRLSRLSPRLYSRLRSISGALLSQGVSNKRTRRPVVTAHNRLCRCLRFQMVFLPL